MPRDVSGNYTLPPLNPVVGGTVIDITWANNTMGDIATQLNNVFTRDGVLGPTGTFKIIDGTLATPGLAFNSELGLGIFREAQGILGVAVGGNTVGRFQATGFSTPENLGVAKNATVGGTLNVAGPITNAGVPAAFVPTGTILDFAGPDVTVPVGYLVCRGQAVSRTTYAALFAAIGGYWGSGDGSTTFNVPDLQRYFTCGLGGSNGGYSGPGAALGNKGGAELNVLQVTHMPSHAHGATGWQDGHNHGIVTGTHNHIVRDPGHAHVTTLQAYWGSLNTGHFGWCSDDAPSAAGAPGVASDARLTGIWLDAVGDLGGYTDVRTPAVGVSIAAAGSGTPYTNFPPTAIVNKIIKT
jgi:microcystin-dependent protein